MHTSTGTVAQLVRMEILTVRQPDNGRESQRRPQFESLLPPFLPSSSKSEKTKSCWFLDHIGDRVFANLFPAFLCW